MAKTEHITTRRAILAGAAALPALAVPALATTPIKDDHTFAAIDHTRKCEQEFLALAKREDEARGAGIKLETAPGDYRTPEMVAAAKEAIAARIALARNVPTTPAGFAALTTFIREESAERGEFYFAADDPDEQLLFVASLDAAARGMSGMKPWAGHTNPPTADPAFAAIERFKAFDAETDATAMAEPRSRSPEHPLWEVRREREMDNWRALRDAMLETVPTTRAGAFALIDAAQEVQGIEDDIDAEDALMLLKTIAKAVQS